MKKKLKIDVRVTGTKKQLIRALKETAEWVQKNIDDNTIRHYYSKGNSIDLTVAEEIKIRKRK